MSWEPLLALLPLGGGLSLRTGLWGLIEPLEHLHLDLMFQPP